MTIEQEIREAAQQILRTDNELCYMASQPFGMWEVKDAVNKNYWESHAIRKAIG